MTDDAPPLGAELAELDGSTPAEVAAVATPPPKPKPSIEVAAARCFVACNGFARSHGYRAIILIVADDGTYRWHHDNAVQFEGVINSISRTLKNQ